MALAIYRKYRPQSFTEVIGQNHIKTTLQNEIETGKVAHAYLFSGPRGLGKTTTARLIAKSLNCLNRKDKESNPCNKCDSCTEIMENRSIDVIEIDAASNTGVDNVRENIIANSRFTPTSRKYKVFIIDEVHMLSISAFNALLKTLEEPPSHAIFILATTEIHKIPQTIISRCQRFDFRKVSKVDLVSRLETIAKAERVKVDQIVLENIANQAEGGVRDAESLLGQILSLGDKHITVEQAEIVIPSSHLSLVLEFTELLVKGNATKAIYLINKLVEDGINVNKFVTDLVEVLRKILLTKVGGNLSDFSNSLTKELEKQVELIAKQADLQKLVNIINIFIDVRQDIKSVEIIQLPLEIAVIKICENIEDDNDDDNDDISGSDTTASNLVSTKKADSPKVDSPIKVEAKKPEVKIELKVEKIEEVKEEKESKNKIQVTIDQVKAKWEDVLNYIRQHNHSLASTLTIHKPTRVEDRYVEIAFKYKFHEARVKEMKNKELLENAFENIFGQPLILQTVVVENLPDVDVTPDASPETLEQPKQQNSLDNLAAQFGGQVIQ